MNDEMDSGLRPPTPVDKPYGMRKGAKQRVITSVIMLMLVVLFILFVRGRRTAQDPVKAMKAKAAEQVARGGEPARPAGIQGTKIAPQREQDAVAEFTKASEEAAAKADAERKAKGKTAGGPGGQTPPGMASDGTAGPSDAYGRGGDGAEAGERGASGATGNAGNPSGFSTGSGAFDHSRYYRDENGQLVEPSYLKGRTSPVTREGHMAIDMAYMAGLVSGTTVGDAPDEQRALEALSQRYKGVQRGLWTYSVPKKAPKTQESLSPEQLAQLQQLLKQRGGVQ